MKRDAQGRRVAAPRPLDEIVMSPLNVSAVMRAAPPPIANVKRFDVDAPMPCSPGLSVIGKSLSISPFQVETVSCALASRGTCSRMSPECVRQARTGRAGSIDAVVVTSPLVVLARTSLT